MNQERFMKVLLSPCISEKASLIAEKYKQFTFKVMPSATKLDIRKAVEQMFNVKVASVRVINQKGKTRRFGGKIGRCNHTKKAYVKLQPGFNIDFMELG